MAKLYKGKNSVEVPHTIDIKEWEKAGWSLEDPKGKVPENKNLGDMIAEEFETVKDSLSDLNAEGIKRVAKFLEVDYTNMKDTLVTIEDKLAL